MRKIIIPAAIMALGLSACGSSEPETGDVGDDMAMDGPILDAPMSAMATLMTADGTEVGTATATGSAGGVTIDVNVTGMEPGLHGVHVHQTGACSPDFAAAGGHWNPDEAPHGLEGEEGQHAGDMPNLEVAADGAGSLSYMLSMSASFDGLLDEDGSAFIVHAGEDDQMTDPSGDSGDRLACGVFEAG